MIPSRKCSAEVEEREECSEKLVEPVTVESGRSDLGGKTGVQEVPGDSPGEGSQNHGLEPQLLLCQCPEQVRGTKWIPDHTAGWPLQSMGMAGDCRTVACWQAWCPIQ